MIGIGISPFLHFGGIGLPPLPSMFNGAVALYNMDYNTIDFVNNNNGVEDGTFSYVPGRIPGGLDRALSVSGTGSSQVTSSSYFDFGSGDFSFAIEFKRTGSGGVEFIMGKSGPAAGPTNTSFALALISDKPSFYVSDGSYHITTGATSVTDTTTWHQVTFRKTGNTYELYLDGLLDGTSDATGITMIATPYKLSFGSLGEYQSVNFSGLINNGYFWNRAITTDEIATLNGSGYDSQYPWGYPLPVYAGNGDSIMAGYLAAPLYLGYLYLLALNKSKFIYNAAVYNTTAGQFLASGVPIKPKTPGISGQLYFIGFGVNDQVVDTVIDYQDNLRDIIDMAIVAGWNVSEIRGVLTPINEAIFPNYQTYVAAAGVVYAEYGITFLNATGEAFDRSDNAHLSTLGHSQMYTWLSTRV